MDLELSPNALQALHDAHGPAAARAWLDRLPARVAELLTEWKLHPTENLHAGTAGLVLRARTSAGSEVALKVAFDERELQAERDALRAAEHLGIDTIVRLHRASHDALATWWVDGATAAPSLTVAQLEALLDSVHVRVPAASGLRTLRAYAHGRLDLAAQRLDRIEPIGIDASRIARAHELVDELATTSEARYVHGDVHPTNILSTATGLVLCDPKGLVGDPAFDAALWSFKGDKLMPRRAWIERLGARFGHERVAGWAVVVGTYQSISYTFHGKRPDRVLAYVELVDELEASLSVAAAATRR